MTIFLLVHQQEQCMQQQVEEALRCMDYTPTLEWEPPNVRLSVDVMVKGRTSTGEHRTVVFEVDGPSHYLLGTSARSGSSLARDAMLLLSNMEVCSCFQGVWVFDFLWPRVRVKWHFVVDCISCHARAAVHLSDWMVLICVL
jgi:hypothetical protein